MKGVQWKNLKPKKEKIIKKEIKKTPIKKIVDSAEAKPEALRISKSNEIKPEIKKVKKQDTEKREYKVKDYENDIKKIKFYTSIYKII